MRPRRLLLVLLLHDVPEEAVIFTRLVARLQLQLHLRVVPFQNRAVRILAVIFRVVPELPGPGAGQETAHPHAGHEIAVFLGGLHREVAACDVAVDQPPPIKP
jgi:hypothetical protein